MKCERCLDTGVINIEPTVYCTKNCTATVLAKQLPPLGGRSRAITTAQMMLAIEDADLALVSRHDLVDVLTTIWCIPSGTEGSAIALAKAIDIYDDLNSPELAPDLDDEEEEEEIPT